MLCLLSTKNGVLCPRIVLSLSRSGCFPDVRCSAGQGTCIHMLHRGLYFRLSTFPRTWLFVGFGGLVRCVALFQGIPEEDVDADVDACVSHARARTDTQCCDARCTLVFRSAHFGIVTETVTVSICAGRCSSRHVPGACGQWIAVVESLVQSHQSVGTVPGERMRCCQDENGLGAPPAFDPAD
ncbi:hypothetical protein EXIGLDRAFT_66572 [Exidia glandulosa HHB12029]|uniref:Uncharacterized protein n=1 Tax=Exidia glandulosa HHB12029 TaxID=1314781 RepID=A0A165P3N0_EXIGL|nr:hypothetical protein EXIGLDRAFT_66572 [Exidia glandulosa HHB12029]